MEQPKEPGFYWARVTSRDGELRWMAVELSRWGFEMGKIMLQPHHVLVPGESGARCPSTVTEWGPRIEPPDAPR